MLKRVIPLPLVISAILSGCGGGADQTSADNTSMENNPPKIALAGATMVKVAQGAAYVDPGFTATDLEDGDITDRVVSDADAVDTSKEGVQKVTYTVVDSANANAEVKVRGVAVVKGSAAISADAPAAGEIPLVAKDDYIEVTPGDDKELSVSDNDTYTPGETTFEVVEYPQEGELVMDPAGGFIYHANNGFTGADSFTYSAQDGVSVQQATVTVDVASASDSKGKGFTAIKPSADSQLIYVSSSTGADSNDCLSPSAPCESLEAAFDKARPGLPDHVYLKRGDVWRDQKLTGLKSGRSVDEPAVVSFYGNSGERPKIEHSDSIISLNGGDRAVKYLHIIGLYFDAYKMDIENPHFSGTNEDHANLKFLGGNKNILLEDNVFSHIEVVVQGFDGQNPTNFTLRRNIWTGAYGDNSSYDQLHRPSNIYAASVDGLHIEENVFDHGGWHEEAEGAGGNMYNHNLYLQSGSNSDRLVVRNNIITRGSSHGAQLRSGGLAEDNFFGRNAVGLLIGYDLKPLKDGVRAHAVNNVITEGASMVKGAEPCSGLNLCTSAQWGLEFNTNGNADWVAKGNLVHSLDESNDDWEQEYDQLMTRAFKGVDDPAVTSTGNLQASWGEEVPEGVTELAGPTSTLGEYYLQLVQEGAFTEQPSGEDDFDRFMTVVKSRGLQQWDERLTAKAINEFIRGGLAL